MKKKKYILLCVLIIAFNLVGCKKVTVVDDNGIEHITFGRFVTLNEEHYYTYEHHRQYIVYDKNTKIMYIIDRTNNGAFSISPFYVMNSKNEPVIGIYNGDLEDVE